MGCWNCRGWHVLARRLLLQYSFDPTVPVIRRFGLALTLLCSTASVATAQNVVGRANGLSGGFGSFDFNSLALNEGQALGSLSNNGKL